MEMGPNSASKGRSVQEITHRKKALSSEVQDDGRGGRGYYYFIGAASCKVTGQGTEDRLTANWVLQPYIGIVH